MLIYKNLFMIFAACLLALAVEARVGGIGFFAPKPFYLEFTTSAQSIYTSNCSAAVSVQTKNRAGVATSVASDLTVNLSGPGSVTFFSDENCVTAITTVTISTGTSAASFYFIGSANGSAGLTAAAVGYASANQSETLATNPYVWTGAGGNVFWATGSNWSGGSAPGATQVAVLDGTCSSNCSPTIAADPNVLGVRVASGYSGTITQSAVMSIGPRGWVHLGGTFTGGSAAIDSFGTLRIAGGTWTSTSGVLTISNSGYGYLCTSMTSFNRTAGTFAHNNGTLHLVGGSGGYCNSTQLISATSAINLYHLDLDNTYSGYGGGMGYTATQPLNVAGNLTIHASVGGSVFASGTINLSGNLYGLSGAAGGAGTVNVIGNGTQVYTGSTSGILPNVVVNTSGTFGPSGATDLSAKSLTLQQGAFTAPNGTLTLAGTYCATETLFNKTSGTFAHNSGTVRLTGGPESYCAGSYSIAGSSAINFNNLKFDNLDMGSLGPESAGSFYSATQPLNVAGDLTIGATVGGTSFNSGTINLSGNLNGLTGARGGNGTINVIGNGAQVYTGAVGARLPKLVVNTSGTLSPNTGVTMLGATSLTLSQGVFTAPSGTLTLAGNSCAAETLFDKSGGTFTNNNGTVLFTGKSNGFCAGSYTIGGTSAINFKHLKFDNWESAFGIGSEFLATQQLNVAGNLEMIASLGNTTLTSITINLSGNLSLATSTDGGTSTLNFVGSTTQTITQGTSELKFTGGIALNQTGAGKVSLVAAVTGSATSIAVTAGAIDMNGYSLTILGLTLNGTTISRQNAAASPGTLTVNGTPYSTGSYFGGTVAN